MDGTLVDSGPVVRARLVGLGDRAGADVAGLLPVAHGRRAIETITMFAKTVRDPEAEARKLEDAERLDIDGLKPIEGALALIASLPADRWALVTSADEALARKRLAACGFPVPEVLVTAGIRGTRQARAGSVFTGCAGTRLRRRRLHRVRGADAGLAAGHAAKAQVIAVSPRSSRLKRWTGRRSFGFLTLAICACNWSMGYCI